MLCTGQVYQASLTVYGQEAAPSTCTLTITKPDGTDTKVTAGWVWAQDGQDWTTTYDYILPGPGLYRVAWVTQGPGTAPPPDYLTVRNYISLVSMAETKAHLNITRPIDDAELARFMMAATELVESKGGFTVRRQVTDRVYEGTQVLALPRRPVLSVESVTSVFGGQVWATAQLEVDAAAGLVYQKGWAWPFWWPPWDVAYTVGRAVPLESHLHATKELVRHLWDTQRGSMPPSVLGGEEVYTTSFGMAFSYPRRVLEALENEMDPAI